jgi:predicted DsbA family dithiol-disulfide isomerase
MHLIIYFDYTCPYSYAAALWLQRVQAREPDLTTEWRPFIVKEINRAPGEGVPFWEQEGVMRTRTAQAFIAGQAAARQGPAAYDRFRLALQAAFHAPPRDIREPGVLEVLAAAAGLNVARFTADRQDRGLLREVGRSHQEAVARYAVFGTPTLVFPTSCAVYLKLAPAPEGAEAEQVFALLRDLIMQHPAVQEIKLTRQEHP